ncbi:hypothetical protein ACFFV7_24100 [Nonomuraea spiralis]|uniref:Uncharacterized protein n=1 Tax=Nonomuraea spiralis TaxID=46182 RepID=A0ABV5IIC8_9ACTN|nr:hypothetical protein [Nonomuraea spiralis]
MKRVVLLLVGMTAAGFLSVGWVRAADGGPDLGESVLVSPTPGTSPGGVRPFTTPGTKAEPVKPPSPKPGGGDDDGDHDRHRALPGGDDDDDDDGHDGHQDDDYDDGGDDDDDDDD